jgi:hypothetical protein
MIWDAAVAHALALDGAEASASYGRPAIKANGNTFLSVGQEADTSFVLHLDPDLVAMLIDTHPETFWQTSHYEGYAAVLVRYRTTDDTLVREMIDRAHARASAKRPPRPRTAR